MAASPGDCDMEKGRDSPASPQPSCDLSSCLETACSEQRRWTRNLYQIITILVGSDFSWIFHLSGEVTTWLVFVVSSYRCSLLTTVVTMALRCRHFWLIVLPVLPSFHILEPQSTPTYDTIIYCMYIYIYYMVRLNMWYTGIPQTCFFPIGKIMINQLDLRVPYFKTNPSMYTNVYAFFRMYIYIYNVYTLWCFSSSDRHSMHSN